MPGAASHSIGAPDAEGDSASHRATRFGGPLTPSTYRNWLHDLAVRFVAVSDARLDFSSHHDIEVVNAGVPGWTWLQGLKFLETRGFSAVRPLTRMLFGRSQRFDDSARTFVRLAAMSAR